MHSRRRAAVDVGQHIDSVAAPKGVFVIHFSILALVSLLIAYNLRFEVRASLLGALLFSIALILHFFGTDRTMEIHYHSMFERYGRYMLSIMPLTGWALSIFFPERQSSGKAVRGCSTSGIRSRSSALQCY